MLASGEGDDEDWQLYLEKKGREDQKTKLQALKLRLVDPPVDICANENRKIFHEGTLQRQTRFKSVTRRVILLSDLLVVAKPLTRDRLQVKQVLDLRKLTINNYVKGMKHSFVVQTPESQYVLGAASDAERNEWVVALTKAIVDLRALDSKNDDPLEKAINHLQGLLKTGEEDPVVTDSVRQVLQLLDNVKKSGGLKPRKTQFRKKMDKTLKTQAPDIQSWLQKEFMSQPRKTESENSTSSSSSRSQASYTPPGSPQPQKLAAYFVAQAKKSREGKIVRRVMHVLKTRSELESQMSEGSLSVEEEKLLEQALADRIRSEMQRMPAFQQIQFQICGFTTRALLKKSDNWDSFDVWRLDEASMGRPLSVLLWHLFQQYGFFERFNVKQIDFARFVTKIEDGYNAVPYHNRLHATDVLQNMNCWLNAPSFRNVVTSGDVMAALVAAAIHDFRHPGTTNVYHVNTESEHAIQFNDMSVLESMHSAEAFKVMRSAGFDILAGVGGALRREIRESIITMVLATDMKKHFELHQELHDYVAAHAASEAQQSQSPDPHRLRAPSAAPPAAGGQGQGQGQGGTGSSPLQRPQRLLFLQAAMHCSDLGNPAKPLPLYLRWTDLIMKEFFAQGDRERELGLPISPMCDRTKPAIEKSQIGFISVIVKPLFTTFTRLIPDMVHTHLHLDRNQAYWTDMLAASNPQTPQTPQTPSGPPPAGGPSLNAQNSQSSVPPNGQQNLQHGSLNVPGSGGGGVPSMGGRLSNASPKANKKHPPSPRKPTSLHHEAPDTEDEET